MPESDAAMAGIRVRPATGRDLPATLELVAELDRLQADCRVFAPLPDLRQEVAERYRRAIDDPGGDDLLLVAEEGGLVVGTAFGHVLVPSTVSDERAVELGGVIVRDAHRGRGIGLALAQEIARFARARGIRIVVLKTFASNEPALRFWERIGFLPRMVQMVTHADRLAGRDGPDGPEA